MRRTGWLVFGAGIGQRGGMRNPIVILCALAALSLGCSEDDEPGAAPVDGAVVADRAVEPAPDTGSTDAGPTDVGRADMDSADRGPADSALADAAVDASPTLPADRYCEEAVDVFCPYYVRCGRMAVADEAECRQVFIESCNAKYEPIYRAHADAGELVLSRAGLAACGAHLDAVDCAAHDFDLDGPCGAVWPGQVGAGGVCGPGIGVFVCAEGTTCRLSIETFCGTCEPSVAVGEACGEGARCGDDGECRDGLCARRPAANEPCADDSPRCATGSRCVDGRCTIRPWAGPGEACGQAARCRYKSDCVDGICVEGALLGAACGAGQPCATGWCDGGRCAAPRAAGEPCGAAACVSGACVGGVCLDERGGCFVQ